MSTNLNRALDVLDVGSQSSFEHGCGTDIFPNDCARCRLTPPAANGDLCGQCRAFLLGDSQTDPLEADWEEAARRVREALNATPEEIDRAWQALSALVSSAWDAIESSVAALVESFNTLYRSFERAGLIPPRQSKTLSDWRIEQHQAGREWERALLADRRRSHRRTNRLGPPPGR